MAQSFESGGIAVITGGASGIGLALAKKCHGYGMSVIVADKNEESLASVKKSIGDRVTTVKLDVGRLEEWASLKTTIEQDFNGRVNILALNAGMGVRGASWEDPAAFQNTLQTNFMGVVNGISTFLPVVKDTAASGSHTAIIITGSKQGITNPPGNPSYNASKAAVKSVAEHLSWDLRAEERISVHLLIPGWTYTGMTGNRPGADSTKPNGAWWPEQVVDYLESKMKDGQFWVLCPDNEVTESLDRRRMLWSAGDAVEGRPPLSRWREDWKARAQEGIDKMGQ
ncbi:hypothetical protein jhhlp_004863 [Lomentospora prolificans]|uniref:Uncharacterized protein n=1 Tax=Lomentospora prolificans TaxID=41688 RepID=A0A2N3N7R0_9PEZI|nr:hypothetical protein jhhlp_004863 [Lomentospora prolificans]